jgi:hypothetical protein
MSRSYGFELSRLQRSVLDIISGFPGYSTIVSSSTKSSNPTGVSPILPQTRFLASSSTKKSVGSVTRLRLINADTDEAMAAYDPLLGRVTIDLDTLPTDNLNIEAVAQGRVQSLAWRIDNVIRVEQTPLWSLCGNTGLDFYACASLKNGFNATIQAIPYSGKNAAGVAGQVVSVDLALFRTSTSPFEMTLTLIDAHADSKIGPLLNNTIIDLAQTPDVNVRANVESSALIASVQFGLDGRIWRIENESPYTFWARTISLGHHQWVVTPWLPWHLAQRMRKAHCDRSCRYRSALTTRAPFRCCRGQRRVQRQPQTQ